MKRSIILSVLLGAVLIFSSPAYARSQGYNRHGSGRRDHSYDKGDYVFKYGVHVLHDFFHADHGRHYKYRKRYGRFHRKHDKRFCRISYHNHGRYGRHGRYKRYCYRH